MLSPGSSQLTIIACPPPDLYWHQLDSVLVTGLAEQPAVGGAGIVDSELGGIHHEAIGLAAQAVEDLKEHDRVAEIGRVGDILDVGEAGPVDTVDRPRRRPAAISRSERGWDSGRRAETVEAARGKLEQAKDDEQQDGDDDGGADGLGGQQLHDVGGGLVARLVTRSGTETRVATSVEKTWEETSDGDHCIFVHWMK